MLYDPKYDKLLPATKPSLDDFKSWLREQNPRECYHYEADDCAAARYGRARGFKLNTTLRQARAFGFVDFDWAWIVNVSTYGQLLKRLERTPQ